MIFLVNLLKIKVISVNMAFEHQNYPKVSIIILNYNGRKFLGCFLEKAIESAINQDYPNIEVLFIDNGSTDDSYQYVKFMYDKNIKVIKFNKNYGYCLGNNLATRHISGDSKYILFMNSSFSHIMFIENYIRIHE